MLLTGVRIHEQWLPPVKAIMVGGECYKNVSNLKQI